MDKLICHTSWMRDVPDDILVTTLSIPGTHNMDKSCTDVLPFVSSFLEKYPSETILMLINEESRVDSGLGRFAPSEILGKLPRGDTTIRNRTSPLKIHLRKKRGNISQRRRCSTILEPTVPDEVPMTSGPGLTSETTLGDVRGKIVLLRRFEGGQDVGFDATYCRKIRPSEAQHFRCTSCMIVIKRQLSPT